MRKINEFGGSLLVPVQHLIEWQIIQPDEVHPVQQTA